MNHPTHKVTNIPDEIASKLYKVSKLYKQWENALIIKMFGRSFGFNMCGIDQPNCGDLRESLK